MYHQNMSLEAAVHAVKNISEGSYWRKKLAGDLEKSFFPGDNDRKFPVEAGPLPGKVAGTFSFKFPQALFMRLMKIINQSDARLNMVLTTGIIVLLEKYTGNNDIIVSTPVYKQKVEGKFVNTVLLLRNQVPPAISFKNLLLHVRQTISEAIENQNYPLKALLHLLDIPLDEESDFALSDIAILLKNIQDREYIRHLRHNMIFSFLRTPDSLEAEIEYNSSLYREETIHRLADHFLRLMEQALNNVDLKVCEIDILSGEEKKQQLIELNRTDSDYPGHMTIHELFSQQVKETPDHTAVVYGHQTFTYAALNSNANQLAHQLRKTGIAPDSVGGVLIERSLEMVIGLLAILKAGGAYLPMDPEAPAYRILHMLEDACAPILLTTKGIITKNFQAHTFSQELVILDLQDLTREHEPVEPPGNVNRQQDLAYVIYTSGSTGKPKGVMVEHRNVGNVVTWFSRQYHLQPGINVLQMSDYTFDASVNQIFATLLQGSSLHIIDKRLQSDFTGLRRYIEKNHIHIINFVPQFLHELLRDYQRLESIRVVLSGGEPLADTIKDAIIEMGYELYNQYGPTETTIDALAAKCTKDKINLGKPIANTRVFIFNKYNWLVPGGAPGELVIGGAGLARGYLNQPVLTGEKFIDNPYLPGERIYKTGDMTRWLPDGTIEFLGRLDNQVKIRGYRMEPGEIENQLLSHKEIKEAVVLAKEHKNGDKYLCAYIVRDKTPLESNDCQELNEYLAHRLPVYMIPSHYVQLEKIPLTAVGKIDRKALPEPEIDTRAEYIAPRNEIERGIVYILSEILEIEAARVSVRANLFDIGVNSITLIKIINRISDEFNTYVPISTLFANSTVEGIVMNMRKNLIPIKARRMVLLNRGKASRNLFLLTGDGAVYCFKELAKLLESQYNVYGIQARGIMETGKLPGRKEILKEYFKEIKMIQAKGPYWVGGHCVGAVTAYELGRLLEDQKEVVKVVVLDVNAFIPEEILDHYKIYRAIFLLRKFYRKVKSIRWNKKNADVEVKNNEEENKLPEDLEARRKEVEKNLARLFDIYIELKRIIHSPILVFKAIDTANKDSPRWHPRVWSMMSTQTVEILPTPGDHFSIFEPPHVSTLARLMLENM